MTAEVATITEIVDSDIVPEEYQYLLIYWADQFRRGYYDIGEIANDIIKIAKSKEMNIPVERIYRAVGRFCGKSGRTVKYYSEVASFFPREIYEEYDMVPFSHFAFALKMKSRWKEVLDYSRSVPYTTLEELERKFLVSKDTESSIQEDNLDLSYMTESSTLKNAAVLSIPVDEDRGGNYTRDMDRDKDVAAVHSIKNIISHLLNILDMIDTESPARSNIERALSLLQEALDKFTKI